jgi:hypothetical protein
VYCQNCGAVLAQDANFCPSCGKPQTPASSPTVSTTNAVQISPLDALPRKRPQSKTVWLVMGGIILAVIAGIIGRSPSDSSTPSTQQSSTPDTAPQSQGNEHDQHQAALKPPKYRVYKSTAEVGTAYIVAVGTTDDELKNLLWFFRNEVRTGRFGDIGITGGQNNSSGMLLVYRGAKCANEQFLSIAQLEKGNHGACGDGEHDDAYYQWGINGDPLKDSGGIIAKDGDSTEIFNYEDNWHPSSEVSQVVLDKAKESLHARQQEWEPRQRFAAQIANEFLRRKLAIDVSANADEPKELDFRSKLFRDATFRKTFTDTSVSKIRPDLCKAGFQNIRVLTEDESDAGQSYPLRCQ